MAGNWEDALVGSRVDWGYAFAPPHRLTVARPTSADKTLLDVEPGKLRLAWTYDDLTRFPPMAYMWPAASWHIDVQPQLDGRPFSRSVWARAEGWLPVLANTYEDARGRIRIEAAGGQTGMLAHIQVANTGDQPHRFTIACRGLEGWAGANPAWVDPDDPGDTLLAGWFERADRVLLLAVGGRCPPVDGKTLCLDWTLSPGETAEGWLIRPYRAYAADLPALRTHDWASELSAAKEEWRALLGRAARVEIPDPRVQQAYQACLADLFVMQEPIGNGYIAQTPGTEVYRANGSVEGAIQAVALDQAGLHAEAEAGYRLSLESQGPDGDWADPQGWGHSMWGISGWKAWAALEHYRLTGDRTFLERVYPRLVAASRFQERQRARTRVTTQDGERPLTYGLMPRGQGDCGLLDDGDLYGVFLPHNLWAVMADKLAVEAAEILGHTEDLPELHAILSRALTDLVIALDRGAIEAEGYRWIPGVPGKTSGSRWGVLNAAYPCGILPLRHELIEGTLRHMESNLSPGGLPLNTGWMPDGCWVAIALDNLAELHLARGEGDAAAEYLYAVLNHATPLFTWCEERGGEAGSTKTSGDRQHAWTPISVVRALRDMLIMEEGDGLHLARGAARGWLGSGRPLGISGAATHFGPVSYRVQYDANRDSISGFINFPDDCRLAWARLHVRLPRGLHVGAVNAESHALWREWGQVLEWQAPRGHVEFAASIIPVRKADP